MFSLSHFSSWCFHYLSPPSHVFIISVLLLLFYPISPIFSQSALFIPASNCEHSHNQGKWVPLGNSLGIIKQHKTCFPGPFRIFLSPINISLTSKASTKNNKCHRTVNCRDQTVTKRPVRPRVSAPFICTNTRLWIYVPRPCHFNKINLVYLLNFSDPPIFDNHSNLDFHLCHLNICHFRCIYQQRIHHQHHHLCHCHRNHLLQWENPHSHVSMVLLLTAALTWLISSISRESTLHSSFGSETTWTISNSNSY